MINDLLTGFINEHAEILQGMSGHVEKYVVKCIIMLLPQLSYKH